jgi:SAM-dependent methyltransferase
MHSDCYQRLRCPQCQGRLGLQLESSANADHAAGWLDCLACITRFPIVDGIPRFVPVGNYADSFGIVWHAFRRAVLDSALGVTHTRERFFRETGWTAADLQDRWVLEVGCGAGRFTEILLDCGAHVVAVDYSSAIDDCRRNLGTSPRLHLLQADVYALPFRPGGFDAVCSFGMLHRTPDARRACLALPPQLKEGGKLVVDIAPPRWFRSFGPTAWLRLLTRRMTTDQAMQFALKLTGWLLPCQQALGRVPAVGRTLQRLLPIAPVEALQTCSPEAVRQRAGLAMCDRLTAVHHHPGRVETLAAWLREAELEQTQVESQHLIVGRGVKPRRAAEPSTSARAA